LTRWLRLARKSLSRPKATLKAKEASMAKRTKISNFSEMVVVNEGWTTWVVCSFKNNEEMRFKVGPFGPEEEIEKRSLQNDGEWSEWELA
jgi:hypothetical protein